MVFSHWKVYFNSGHFAPHFPSSLSIVEGNLILTFCPKGIFKLAITYFSSYWLGRKHVLYNSSRKRKQQAILGSKSQHSTPENTSRKLFIYHLFHQLFLLHFLNAQLQTQLIFLSLCSQFREKAPFPSLTSRSSKAWVSGPRHRLKHAMGSWLCAPAHQSELGEWCVYGTRSLSTILRWSEFQHKFNTKWKHLHLEGRWGQKRGKKTQEVKAMSTRFKNRFISFAPVTNFQMPLGPWFQLQPMEGSEAALAKRKLTPKLRD